MRCWHFKLDFNRSDLIFREVTRPYWTNCIKSTAPTGTTWSRSRISILRLASITSPELSSTTPGMYRTKVSVSLWNWPSPWLFLQGIPRQEPWHLQRRPPPAGPRLQEQVLADLVRGRSEHGVGNEVRKISALVESSRLLSTRTTLTGRGSPLWQINSRRAWRPWWPPWAAATPFSYDASSRTSTKDPW